MTASLYLADAYSRERPELFPCSVVPTSSFPDDQAVAHRYIYL